MFYRIPFVTALGNIKIVRGGGIIIDRELKFRAKRKDKPEERVYGYYVHMQYYQDRHVIFPSKESAYYTDRNVPIAIGGIEIIPETLSLYVGFKRELKLNKRRLNNMASGYTKPVMEESNYGKSQYVIKVKKLKDNAKIPEKAHSSDAGWDLFSAETVTIPPLSSKLISTGIAIELPDNYFAKIFDRSGNALKRGFHVLAGVIDNEYRGEIKVVLYNYTTEPITIHEHDKIAQMVLLKTYYSEVIEVEELSNTARGQKGFGSSGK